MSLGVATVQVVLGVTGKYCAGKSKVVRILAERGFEVIDVDKIGHAALDQCCTQVLAKFGSRIKQGEVINRRKLGSIVFADARARFELEKILHPVMLAMVNSEIRTISGPVVIDAALLYRIGLHYSCQLVVWVSAPLYLRFYRGLRRDHLVFRRVCNIMRAQRGFRAPISNLLPTVVEITNCWREERLISQIESLVTERGLIRKDDE